MGTRIDFNHPDNIAAIVGVLKGRYGSDVGRALGFSGNQVSRRFQKAEAERNARTGEKFGIADFRKGRGVMAGVMDAVFTDKEVLQLIMKKMRENGIVMCEIEKADRIITSRTKLQRLAAAVVVELDNLRARKSETIKVKTKKSNGDKVVPGQLRLVS